jgi:hypothetical protein
LDLPATNIKEAHMTALDEVTGNPDRSIALLALVHEAATEGNLTLDHVGSKTHRYDNEHGPFGPISEDEYNAAVKLIQTPVEEFTPTAEPEAPTVEVQAEPVETVEQPPAMSREEANAELNARNNDLHVARLDKTKAEAVRARCRDALSKALLAWNAGGASKDEIRRNEINAINRDRANKVEAVHAERVLRSVIDAQAYYQTQGDARAMVWKRHRHGGSHHRPARGLDGRLQEVGKRAAPKLPSEL